MIVRPLSLITSSLPAAPLHPRPCPYPGPPPRGAGPGKWSRGGEQQSDPSMAPDILSFGRRSQPASNLDGQSNPRRPPVTTSRRLRPKDTATAAWPAIGDRCPLALDPTPAPLGTRPPLSGPWRQTRGWDSYPPCQYAPCGFFQKFIPDKFGNIPTTSRVIGPGPKIFKLISGRGEGGGAGSRIPLKKACTRFCGVITLRPRG